MVEKGLEVGVLTMHRVLNYGSFMQAYALKRVIESFGHKVTFRDFKNGSPRHVGDKVKKSGGIRKLAKLPRVLSDISGTLHNRRFNSELKKCFEQVCWPLLNVPQEPDYNLSADIMVIGSDEVFNYTQNHAFGYVPCLFGHGVEAPVIISYAASAGYANAGDVVNDGMKEEISSGLNRIKHIAVRDENTRELVECCINKTPTLVIDPTLVYDFDALLPKSPVVNGDYLLVYAYAGRMAAHEIEIVREFAVKNQLKLVSAGAYHAWCDENIVVAPFELLRVFKDAAFVVTDTFHGSIFAMKSNRQFATLIRKQHKLGSNSNKVLYLLRQFGLDSRIVTDLSQMDNVLSAPAPWVDFRARLEPLQKQSHDFLRTALSVGE